MELSANSTKTIIHTLDRRKKRFPLRNKESKYVAVKISDTGTGIKPDDVDSIFDPFFTTKPQGAGLGLSIVYRIIEEHEGDIRVESNSGHGTTFTVLLPAEEEN